MDQVKFVEDSLKKNCWSMACFPFKVFEDCILEILLGPFMNTLSHIMLLVQLSILGY